MTDNCWIYAGVIDHGYGIVSANYKNYKAHRVMYEDKHGVIPDGLVVDHLCEVKACINPEHLEAVTQKENVRRWSVKHPGKRTGRPRRVLHT